MQPYELAFSGPEGIVVVIDLSVYRLTSVKKAAYKFGDRFHVLIEEIEPTKLRVTLKAKRQLTDPESHAGDFCNEILDQDLRETIAAETDGVRNLLLAHAFSRTSLTDDGHESADYHPDPFNIGPHAEGDAEKT